MTFSENIIFNFHDIIFLGYFPWQDFFPCFSMTVEPCVCVLDWMFAVTEVELLKEWVGGNVVRCGLVESRTVIRTSLSTFHTDVMCITHTVHSNLRCYFPVSRSGHHRRRPSDNGARNQHRHSNGLELPTLDRRGWRGRWAVASDGILSRAVATATVQQFPLRRF